MWNVFLTDFTDVTKKLESGLAEEVKGKEPVNQQIHRMCLLRVKLMHFVNSLHNYIMTRVREIDLFTVPKYITSEAAKLIWPWLMDQGPLIWVQNWLC